MTKKHHTNIPYCTCGIDNLHYFEKLAWLGGSATVVITGVGLWLLIEKDRSILPLLAFYYLVVLVYGIEHYDEARYLKHSKACALRFACIASLVSIRGYYPEYSGMAKYESVYVRFIKKKLGVRRANRLFKRAKVIGWLLVGSIVIGAIMLDITGVV